MFVELEKEIYIQKTLKLKRLLEVQINPSQPFKTQENETLYKKMKQNV